MKSCTCISSLEKENISNTVPFLQKRYKSKIVGKPELKNVSLVFEKRAIRAITNSTIVIKIEGRKKPVEQTILNSFCPFCGNKYPRSNGKEI